jgi:hypothetical protein
VFTILAILFSLLADTFSMLEEDKETTKNDVTKALGSSLLIMSFALGFSVWANQWTKIVRLVISGIAVICLDSIIYS